MVVEITEGSCVGVKRCINTVITLTPSDEESACEVETGTTCTSKPCGVTGYLKKNTKIFY